MEHKNAVLQGLELMRKYDRRGDGPQFTVEENTYSVDEMIGHVKDGTDIGNQFSQSVYDAVLVYMGKFSQNAD